MADSLFDILARKSFEEPPEVTAIKQYIQDHFHEPSEILIHPHDIIITVASAALANTLRFHVRQLRTAASTTKRLVFRVR